MNRNPTTVKVTVVFMLVTATFWLGFAILTALGAIAAISGLGITRWIMVSLALVTAAALTALALNLRRSGRRAFFLSVGLLAVVAVL